MSDAEDVVTGARQLGSTSQWDKTPRDLRKAYNPDKKEQWGGAAIHATATELTTRFGSRSEFRPNDDPVDTLAGLVINVDARVDELHTILLAVLVNHGPSIERLRTLAEKSPLAKAALEAAEK
ncbi:hypothetical protein SEA_FORZA_110 [Gordonia phage Forza]|uniref:Uncharacterized protein n=1 Tax=Gordonia phage Forza TaxID=2571247 RepID=A0A650EYD8_9CAUD|nr:hypothetical protein PP303_gp110 [Gordonia phage Forza]QEM41577.1 hypothetical protein SEA_BOOPY_110 [Gordonia phage Boopy]QGT55103.1 hypothetical protein SEA_FORZA_110 [Gordonia phage Forza]UXE04251.1 hypothetical protein SEA_BLUENGOLD_109 [Gordonia phage BlueNGold]WBF03891.1 hypothetical protein SEA_MAREELIH_108 [Gordonia phage Mareelih]